MVNSKWGKTPFAFYLIAPGFFLLSYHLIIVSSAFCASEPPNPPIHLQSDFLEYDENQQVILASGNVSVQQTSYTFYSDSCRFQIPDKTLSAAGRVRFMDLSGNEIRAKSLQYSAESGSAQLKQTEGHFSSWLFSAEDVLRDEQGNFFLERARLSTCETDLRKYHLYGHKIKILPQKRLTVQHALFKIGPVPVLYLPYYYYSLGEKHLAFQIYPGQSQSEGTFVRSAWGYPTTDQTYLKVYLDYMALRGAGTGGEFNYYFGDQAKGSLYGYRVYDKASEKERWNARLFHWQKLSPRWILQTNANRLSDDQFPNDFFKEDFNRVIRDVKSSLALTYQRDIYFFRILGERTDLFDLNKSSDFFPSDIFAPRAEFQVLQSPLGFWNIEKIISANFSNRFAGRNFAGEELSRDYRRESELVGQFLRSFSLTRQTNLVPKLILKNQWVDHPQGNEPSEQLVQRIETESLLRQRIGDGTDIDLTYRYGKRLQANQGEDMGIEKHSLSFFSLVKPRDWVSLRFETAHQLPKRKGESLSFLNRKNYDPLRAEFFIQPRRDFEFFARQETTLYDPVTGSAHLLSTQMELNWRERAKDATFFSFSASYHSSREHSFEIRQLAGFSPWRKWRLEASLRSLLFYKNLNFLNIVAAEVLEKEVKARTEWRCWLFSIILRERKQNLEFFFNIELQFEKASREKFVPSRQESEWYPWRSYQ